MTTKLELLTALNDSLSAASVGGFWTSAMKYRYLDNAGQRVCGFYRWSFLELALEITTEDDGDGDPRIYYDYPSGDDRLKPDSIYQIDIEDEVYPLNQQGRRRVSWAQYQKMVQEQSDELVYTNHNGFYFLNTPPITGKEMNIYGLKEWKKLSTMADDDEIISPVEFDESIVRLALASCLRKAKKYAEAKAETVEVLDPQFGSLAQMKADIENENSKGYGGKSTSSRFEGRD